MALPASKKRKVEHNGSGKDDASFAPSGSKFQTDNTLSRYDYVVELKLDAIDGGLTKLSEVLTRGLGDRVTQIVVSSPPQESVKVGIVVNADTVNRTVDHGPAAENKAEASSFRKFWAGKAELRRFKDGSILESLIWAPSDGKQSVLEQIVRFLLQKHFSDETEQSAVFVGDGFTKMLRQGATIATFQPLMEAFKQLETDIRGLELPLSVRQIMPADAQLRYASILPPVGAKGQHRRMPANVTLQFEGSARWPDDLVAIQRTKIAFLLNLSEKLQESVSALTARTGLENGDRDILNQAYLDIIYDSGPAFRMRIHHDREQTLLEKQLKDKASAPSTKEAAAVGLAAYKRDYLKAPSHTQSIARLCSRHPALSGTIRLLKKWFASHLLANHVPDEVIELIATRTFVQPSTWRIPSSSQTGFLRTLQWLSRWDWRTEPLIVDLSGSKELKKPEVQAIQTSFEAWRKLDPSMNRVVLFAASNVDTEGTTWTDGQPAKVVAARMSGLAKAACAEVEEKKLELDAASLFVSPLSDYDFVLHLNADFTGGKRRKGASKGPSFKNLELAVLDDETLVGFDPIQTFLDELQELYSSSVVLFSGATEKPVIAGLWSPQTAPRKWKVNLAYSTIPAKGSKGGGDEEEVQAEINKEAVLAEIARLGGDLIERVEVNR